VFLGRQFESSSRSTRSTIAPATPLVSAWRDVATKPKTAAVREIAAGRSGRYKPSRHTFAGPAYRHAPTKGG